MSDIDASIAEVRSRMQGRTRYEGQPPYTDELLVEEIARLRARVAELEAALGETVRQIEYLHEKFQPTGSGETVLARARRALGKEDAT